MVSLKCNYCKDQGWIKRGAHRLESCAYCDKGRAHTQYEYVLPPWYIRVRWHVCLIVLAVVIRGLMIAQNG